MTSTDPADLLRRSPVLAVVGCSTDPQKDANRVPAWLQSAGFDVHPVHPSATEILGLAAVATLEDVDVVPDLVIVFRPSAEAADVTRQAIDVGAKGVWLQLGIRSDEARNLAADAGIDYVENTCSYVVARDAGISHPQAG